MSKVVLKMSFNLNQNEEFRGKNKSHIDYIANRKHTDHSLTNKDKEKIMQQLANEGRSTDEQYMQYIKNREGSSGLFSSEGPKSKDSAKSELQNHTGVVWRAIISMRKDDAVEKNMINKQNWQSYVERNMRNFENKILLSDGKLKYVAAFHNKEENPHVHIMMWDPQNQRTTGKIKEEDLNQLRETLVNDLYNEEKLTLLQQLKKSQDRLNNHVKETAITEEAAKNQILKDNLEVKMRQKYKEEFDQLAALVKGGKNNIRYQMATRKIKQKVDEIKEKLMSEPEMKEIFADYVKAKEDYISLYAKDDQETEAYQLFEEKSKKIDEYMELTVKNTILRNAVYYSKEPNFVINQSATKQHRVALERAKKNKLSKKKTSKEILQKIMKQTKIYDVSEEKYKVAAEKLGISKREYRKIKKEINKEETEINIADSYQEIKSDIVSLKYLGLEKSEIEQHLNQKLDKKEALYKKELEKLKKEGHIEVSGSFAKLTKAGLKKSYEEVDYYSEYEEIFKKILEVPKSLEAINQELGDKFLSYNTEEVTNYDVFLIEKYSKNNQLIEENIDKRHKKRIDKLKNYGYIKKDNSISQDFLTRKKELSEELSKNDIKIIDGFHGKFEKKDLKKKWQKKRMEKLAENGYLRATKIPNKTTIYEKLHKYNVEKEKYEDFQKYNTQKIMKFLKKTGYVKQNRQKEYIATDKCINSVSQENEMLKSFVENKGQVNIIEDQKRRKRVVLDGYWEKIHANSKEEDITNNLNIKNNYEKKLKVFATTLINSGFDSEETKEILENNNLNQKELEIVNQQIEKTQDAKKRGKTLINSKSDIEELMQDLGTNKPTKWLYKGINWENRDNYQKDILDEILKVKDEHLEEYLEAQNRYEMSRGELNLSARRSLARELKEDTLGNYF